MRGVGYRLSLSSLWELGAEKMERFFRVDAFANRKNQEAGGRIPQLKYEGTLVMKMSRTVAYAVQATLQLAQVSQNIPTPCSRLAAEGRMPERFLLQILRNLVTHGILQSTRGVDGGYRLERRPEEISLLEVIEAIDGPLTPSIPVSEGLPADSQDRLQTALEQITNTTREQLDAIKLSELMLPISVAAEVEAVRWEPSLT
jgi:Rrf2 family protein